MKVYRGTQGLQVAQTRLGTPSWTPAKQVARVYSAVPGDSWAGRAARWTPDSTLHEGTFDDTNALDWTKWDTYASLADVAQALRLGTPDGITEPELRRVLNYLHNRYMGRVAGSAFRFVVLDEYGEVDDTPLLRSPIADLRDEIFTGDTLYDRMELDRLTADVFIFADAPAVRSAAARLGYDAIKYIDAFGAEDAVEQVLGKGVWELPGVDEYASLPEDPDSWPEEDYVWGHVTVRPLAPGVVRDIKSTPVREANPARRRGSRLLRGL